MWQIKTTDIPDYTTFTAKWLFLQSGVTFKKERGVVFIILTKSAKFSDLIATAPVNVLQMSQIAV